MYYLYIIECADNKLYTGITTDLKRRMREHESGKLGAKYTRGRGPVEIRYFRQFEDRSLASREEYRIKQLSRQKKLEMIQSGQVKENYE